MKRTLLPILMSTLLTHAAMAAPQITWRDLPSLPQALGGQFAGVLGDELIVAGGSYWTGPPWSNGRKIWVDTIYALKRDAKAWRLAGRLPEPLAYGASVAHGDSLLLLGGHNEAGVSNRILRLRMRDGVISADTVAMLPQPLMMMNAVVLGDSIYVAGGQSTPAPTRALSNFWSLPLAELSARAPRWRELPTWPGPGRFFAHMAAATDSLYLAGGSDLVGDPPLRKFLSDANRYKPGSGWQPLPDLPGPLQAGLGAAHDGRFLVFGGSDGSLALRELELKENHPGFSRNLLIFDPASSAWISVPGIPASLVTTTITRFGDEFVIAGGEDRPGHRSARVIAARINFSKDSTNHGHNRR